MSAVVDPEEAIGARRSQRKEISMDAKYNWLMDNTAIRITLNTVALALWVATAVAILELAVKI
jgi:hypothetical protein